jgi:hypothetical protein
MRIQDLHSEEAPDAARIVATVIWEDSDRPTREIYFQTDKAFANDLSCNPHTFLVGSIVPAMRHGEERIAIDEPICPQLRNGLMTAMAWMCNWYGPPRRPVRIEAKSGFRPSLQRDVQRTGSFLSGGIDSLALLRGNRLDFPADHPNSIKDCLVVHGFDIGARAGGNPELEAFGRAVASLTPIAEDANVTLLPISTNIRHLDDDVDFWIYEFHGAALASVAHALSDRLTAAYVASTYDIPNLKPWGSHPLLDPCYSSSDVQIRHDGIRFSRLDKVRLVAGWDIALQSLRVCTMNPPDKSNCGACEKCIRTMLELLALGKLECTAAFGLRDISWELLATVQITNEYEDSCLRELIVPLHEKGRHDLAYILAAKSAQFHKHLAWLEERDWKGIVKRLDRRYLGTNLFRSYKVILERVKSAGLTH